MSFREDTAQDRAERYRPGASQVSGEDKGSTREREPGVKENAPDDMAGEPAKSADGPAKSAASAERIYCSVINYADGRFMYEAEFLEQARSDATERIGDEPYSLPVFINGASGKDLPVVPFPRAEDPFPLTTQRATYDRTDHLGAGGSEDDS